MHRAAWIVCIAFGLAALSGGCVSQRADTSAVTDVTDPAHVAGAGPRVLFDEAHDNYHTASGRYEPFVRLITADGCRVEPSRKSLSTARLADVDVLVIANAAKPLGADEVDAIVAWVVGGGSLLLISDHPPYAAPAASLAKRFDVHVSGAWAADPTQREIGAPRPSWVRYDRATGSLGTHPITDGRGPAERVDTVVTFTGQSLDAPNGTTLLRMSAEAIEYRSRAALQKGDAPRPVAGRAQAVALEHEAGRVVVCGEAAMLTAQVAGRGGREIRVGFGRAQTDNRQFALNIMRWLTRAFEASKE